MKFKKYNNMFKAIRELRLKGKIKEAAEELDRLIHNLFLEPVEEQAKSTNWQLFVSIAYYEKGMIYKSDGNMEKAMEWFSEALKLQQNMVLLGEKSLFTFVYFAYSSFEIAECRRIGAIDKINLETGLHYVEGIIKIAINILTDEIKKGNQNKEIDFDPDYHLAGMWARRAILNESCCNYEPAIRCYKQVLKFANVSSCEFDEGEIESRIARCYLELSSGYCKKSLKHFSKQKNKKREKAIQELIEKINILLESKE